MKAWIWSALCAVGLVLTMMWVWPSGAGSPAERAALDEGRTVITYWDRHTGHEFEAKVRLIDEFNRSQDRIYVRAVQIGFTMEKLLTAIAAGAPPDVLSIENGVLAQLAPQGCFIPLEDVAAREPGLAEKVFFPHAWQAAFFDSHLWAIPTTTNVYGLLWNKTAFRRAGLDPERPPRTIGELEEFAARLTVRDAAGLQQIGFLPWLPWDLSHMWGHLFGGQWYDPTTDAVVCNTAAIAASYAWQQQFTLDPARATQLPFAMAPERIAAFQSGFGAYQSANNPFYTGQVAMIVEGEWQVTFIEKYAPHLDWGVAPIPQPEGAPPCAYAPTCVLDAIPAGSKHPAEAWRFLQWFYSPRYDGGPAPVADYAEAIHNVPCRRADALDIRFMRNPKFQVFVNELLTKPAATYPVMPVSQFLIDETDRLRDRVIFRKETPANAAATIARTAGAQLERARDLLRRAPAGGPIEAERKRLNVAVNEGRP